MLPSALDLRAHHLQMAILLRALGRTKAKVRARAAYVDVPDLLESDWGVASATSVAAVIELRVSGRGRVHGLEWRIIVFQASVDRSVHTLVVPLLLAPALLSQGLLQVLDLDQTFDPSCMLIGGFVRKFTVKLLFAHGLCPATMLRILIVGLSNDWLVLQAQKNLV